ncbi:MAG: helix-turn-helix domain-containing protein [archaeon]|nr:helix-turn-helix domain-containing protein [archaeon]
MKSPCEVIVWDVLPSIRAALTEELIERGLSQKEISKKLGITPAAVSLYLSKKRGYKIDVKNVMKVEIKELANDIIQGNVNNLVLKTCEICMKLRRDKVVCELNKCGVNDECDICLNLNSSKV